MKTALAILLGAALISTGCASSNGQKVDQNALADFKAGVTTEAAVIQRLGQPNSTSTMSDGTKIDTYSSSRTQFNAATYIPFVNLVAGGAKYQASVTMFTFDKNGILLRFSNTNSNHDFNKGIGQ